jgi:hypothetical protein
LAEKARIEGCHQAGVLHWPAGEFGSVGGGALGADVRDLKNGSFVVSLCRIKRASPTMD